MGDHIAFSAGSNNGYHQQIRFPNAPAEPAPSGTQSAIFPLLTGSTQELYFKNASTKTQLTGLDVSASSNGYARLPNGILLKWGQASQGGGNSTFSFPSGGSIPAFSSIFKVFLQPVNADGSPDNYVYVTSFNTTSISVDCVKRTSTSQAACTFSYLAIGA